MKISKIWIRGFQQFEDFELDLTHPETGEPLERICLIGPNGTGKSTLLNILLWLLRNLGDESTQFQRTLRTDPWLGVLRQSFAGSEQDACLVIKVFSKPENFFVCLVSQLPHQLFVYQEQVEEYYEWKEWREQNSAPDWQKFCLPFRIVSAPAYRLDGLDEDIIVYEPADQTLELPQDFPDTSLSAALMLFQDFPVFHAISVATAKNFWNLLIFLIKKRESHLLHLLERPENQNKPISQFKAEFTPNNPEVLKEVGHLWDRVLGKCGLVLDVENAAIPVQVTENLRVYVKSKNTGQPLSYNQLSSGIRSYIFKMGYLKTLYFNRQIKRGFLLIDEPENCLYPDLLYDLMDDYWSIIQNTQSFVSTHSPIIAAQFEPYERFHLDFDDRGYVTATRGISPAGDDPNDLLYKDFRVRSIYGKKGVEKWERFRELRHLIRNTDDAVEKETLMAEYSEIANAYNFAVPR
jgi:predicted ATP-dependent endonuclease of OLD family